jgi:hypothetical protein
MTPRKISGHRTRRTEKRQTDQTHNRPLLPRYHDHGPGRYIKPQNTRTRGGDNGRIFRRRDRKTIESAICRHTGGRVAARHRRKQLHIADGGDDKEDAQRQGVVESAICRARYQTPRPEDFLSRATRSQARTRGPEFFLVKQRQYARGAMV